MKKFRKLGYSMDYILDFSVGIDLKNSTQRTIDVGLQRIQLMKYIFTVLFGIAAGPIGNRIESRVFGERPGR